MTNDSRSTESKQFYGNPRAHLPMGSTLLCCPGCESPNVEVVDVSVCPWDHEDGRPATDVGMLFHCHECVATFRITLFARGLEGTEQVLMEHWMSDGIWS